MAQDVDGAVVATHFEIAVIGSEPAVDLLDHLDPALPHVKAPRRLLTSIAGIALDPDDHYLPALGTSGALGWLLFHACLFICPGALFRNTVGTPVYPLILEKERKNAPHEPFQRNPVMADEKLLHSWRITHGYLEQAITHLPGNAVLECEDGSLERCRDWLEHNELGLAFEELEALGRVNDVPREYWLALLGAAENMGNPGSIAECKRALDGFSA